MIPHFSKLHVMTNVDRRIFEGIRLTEPSKIPEWFDGLEVLPHPEGVFISPRGVYDFVGGDVGYKLAITFGRESMTKKWHPLG